MAAVVTGQGSSAQDRMALAPLEHHPDRLINFETANMMPKGAVKFWVGSHQTLPGVAATGTANQFYYGGAAYAFSDRFQVGLSHSEYHDPPVNPILGTTPQIHFHSTSVQGKFGLYDDGRWKVAAQASIEQFIFRSSLFGVPVTSGESHTVGSLHLPVTYQASDALQLHFLPSVTALPDTIGGNAFMGTVASVGAGFTYKPNLRWVTYGMVNMPLSGGNTITATRAIEKKPVVTLGARYNVTPKGALDLFVTNGAGVTPATRIMTIYPDAKEMLVGATFTYTPGRGPGYRPNYRGLSGEPLSSRDQHLQRDGFTLTSADTFSPGLVVGNATTGSDGAYSGSLVFSPDYDGQMELSYERFANDGSVAAASIPSTDPNYMIGVKLRFMDQNNGSPFSLAVHAQLGRDTSPTLNGTFFVEAPMMYKSSARMALMATPKAAAYGSNEVYGMGLGMNYEVARGVEAIGEVTPVSGGGGRTVWAAGLRYFPGKGNTSFDLHATNAIGSEALGTMIGQSSVKLAFGATIALDFSRR